MTISPARTARAQPAELTNAQLYGLVFSPLGLVETERDTLRREWLNGVPVTAPLSREIPG